MCFMSIFQSSTWYEHFIQREQVNEHLKYTKSYPPVYFALKECISVIEHFPSMDETLGSILCTRKINNKK